MNPGFYKRTDPTGRPSMVEVVHLREVVFWRYVSESRLTEIDPESGEADGFERVQTEAVFYQPLETAVLEVFGGVGAISPDLYRQKLQEVADLTGKPIDEIKDLAPAEMGRWPSPLDYF